MILNPYDTNDWIDVGNAAVMNPLRNERTNSVMVDHAATVNGFWMR